MTGLELLIEGIEAGRHKDIDWIISIYTLTKEPFSDETHDFKPYDIAVDRDTSKRVFYDPIKEGKFTEIKGAGQVSPLIDYKKTYDVPKGALPNIKEDIRTTGGTFLTNLICGVMPFGDLIPYSNKKHKPSDFNVPAQTLYAQDTITVDQLMYYFECVSYLQSLWVISTPTGSKKTMTVSPNVVALKEKLLKEHAGELDNSVVVTNIEAELINADKEDFKGDVAEDFFLKEKSRATSRKKAHIIYGQDDGLGGSKPVLITRALSDGLSVEDIPAGADSTRAASYSRGFLTAQGGEIVNLLYRIFMNSRIVEDDCGTKDGLLELVDKDNMKRFIDRFYIENGKTILIDRENIKGLVGKTILVRSPGRCKSKAPNFCAHCTSKFFLTARDSVHIETSLPGSIIMNDRMKAMHGRLFKVARFIPSKHFS